jgi:hypothetical protein
MRFLFSIILLALFNCTQTPISDEAPAIILQPQSQIVSAGQRALFSVSATGRPAPTYQWKKNSIDIPGASLDTFRIASVQVTDSGIYSVIVSNTLGSVTSANVRLRVIVDPSSAPIDNSDLPVHPDPL